MIISYDNIFKNAVLSATNSGDNKPVSNIVHNYLALVYEASTSESTITAELDADYDCDHVAYGYHNIDSMTMRFYDVLGVLLDTIVVDIYENVNFYYFDTIENVRKIEIDLTSTAYQLYIGGISTGAYLEMPDFEVASDHETKLRDSFFVSGSGQKGGNRQVNLGGHGFNFLNVDYLKDNEIQAFLSYVQKSIPHYVDFYESANDQFPADYCTIVSKSDDKGKRRLAYFKYNLSITWEAAK